MFKKLMEKIMAKKASSRREFLQEINIAQDVKVDEIAEKVANEEPELLVEEDKPKPSPKGKMSKGEFLESVGLGDRPGSQLAATKWEDYCAGI